MSADAAPARRLILLVDDDVLILGLLGKFLQLAGYEVRIATSGAMALAMLAESGRVPDLALLDVAMPGMSGLELAERLHAESDIPVMFLSGNDDQATVRQAIDGGAVGYLVKPVDTARIAPSVQAALARADELRQLRGNEERLTLALQQGREVGMAVGVLMERHRTDRDSAFQVLREHARSQQRKLNDVAAELLAAAEALNIADPRLGPRRVRK
ncbi:response regulator [Massilia violaceinigra]|uniref:Response regulator n=1 Tax=Massilia violaceinigra TaxID=2045208 RepID=A0ABY4AAR8_9BURK|nr:response regulator [Massilia violaceinigra]UOD31059.1 response regulator [Massilia violaceinigra]